MGPFELIGWMVLGGWLGFVLCSLAATGLGLLLNALGHPPRFLGYGEAVDVFGLSILIGAALPIVVYCQGKVSIGAALIPVVGICLVLTALRMGGNEQRMVVVGQEGSQFIAHFAPDFELTPLEGGRPVRLSAQRGRTVMLVFWPRGGHIPSLIDQADRLFRPKGLVTWTINCEDQDAAAIREFVRSRGYQFVVLRDPGGTVSRQYIESGNTTVVIVAPSGKVVRYKQNFFGEDDFWEMLADAGFRKGPPRNAYWIARHQGDCAHLHGAKLIRAQLAGASLGGAYLARADLRGANLAGAVLGDTELVGADLRGANLAGALLESTRMAGADLRGADLTGAFLTDDVGMAGAHYDAHTRWPVDFDPAKHGAVLVK